MISSEPGEYADRIRKSMELTEFVERMTRCHDLVDYDAGNLLDRAMEAADLEGIGVGQFVADYCS